MIQSNDSFFPLPENTNPLFQTIFLFIWHLTVLISEIRNRRLFALKITENASSDSLGFLFVRFVLYRRMCFLTSDSYCSWKSARGFIISYRFKWISESTWFRIWTIISMKWRDININIFELFSKQCFWLPRYELLTNFSSFYSHWIIGHLFQHW